MTENLPPDQPAAGGDVGGGSGLGGDTGISVPWRTLFPISLPNDFDHLNTWPLQRPPKD